MILNRGQIITLSKEKFAKFGYETKSITNISKREEFGVIDVQSATGFINGEDNIVHKQCGSHSIQYIVKNGLKLPTVKTQSYSPKHVDTLTNCICTYVCSVAQIFSGAIGIADVNNAYAPFIVGLSDEEIKQAAQSLIYSLAQTGFSRGGQSLDWKELITISESNDRMNHVRIGKYIDDMILKHGSYFDGNYEILKTEDFGIRTVSFNKSGNVSMRPVKYLARMKHKGKMYQIETTNGMVRVTGDHSLFTYKNGKIVKTKAENLKETDYVISPHKINIKDVCESVSIFDYIDRDELSVLINYREFSDAAKVKFGRGFSEKVAEEVGCSPVTVLSYRKYGKAPVSAYMSVFGDKDFNVCLKGDSNSEIYSNVKITPSLCYLAGMYSSEGHAANKMAYISNNDELIINKVVSALETLGYSNYRVDDKKEYKDKTICGKVAINGVLGYFLSSSCQNGKEKIVPDWVMFSTDECVESFLDGFYDGDGLKHRNGWAGSNCSEFVISGLSFLLLRSGRESSVFIDKREKNENWNTCYEIREKKARLVSEKDGFRYERNYLAKKDNMTEKNNCFIEETDWLIKSDLSFSRIRNIEEYEYDGYVYDISVPDTESFLGGVGSVFFKNTLFTDLNLHINTPTYLLNTPAIGPSGKYYKLVKTMNGDALVECEKKEASTYNDYSAYAQKFLIQMMHVLRDGDKNGLTFMFPKANVHFDDISFMEENKEVMDSVLECSSKNGGIYFLFDRNGESSVSQCCRLKLNLTEDQLSDLKSSPENSRFAAMQNVSVFLPVAALEAIEELGEDASEEAKLSKTVENIKKCMDTCILAHDQKLKYIKNLYNLKSGPLSYAKSGMDGDPYIRLKDLSYLIGIIGLDNTVFAITGQHMHESKKTLKTGIYIVAEIRKYCDELKKKHGMKLSLEETPAESAAGRGCNVAIRRFGDKARKIACAPDSGSPYWNNSVHYDYSADVSFIDRIIDQSKFHSMIDAGAIIHLWVGENLPDKDTIRKIVYKTFKETACSQLTISPEFTICNKCSSVELGVHNKCYSCESEDVCHMSRVVGYNSIIQNWSDSKKAEFSLRNRKVGMGI